MPYTKRSGRENFDKNQNGNNGNFNLSGISNFNSPMNQFQRPGTRAFTHQQEAVVNLNRSSQQQASTPNNFHQSGRVIHTPIMSHNQPNSAQINNVTVRRFKNILR